MCFSTWSRKLRPGILEAPLTIPARWRCQRSPFTEPAAPPPAAPALPQAPARSHSSSSSSSSSSSGRSMHGGAAVVTVSSEAAAGRRRKRRWNRRCCRGVCTGIQAPLHAPDMCCKGPEWAGPKVCNRLLHAWQPCSPHRFERGRWSATHPRTQPTLASCKRTATTRGFLTSGVEHKFGWHTRRNLLLRFAVQLLWSTSHEICAAPYSCQLIHVTKRGT